MFRTSRFRVGVPARFPHPPQLCRTPAVRPVTAMHVIRVTRSYQTAFDRGFNQGFYHGTDHNLSRRTHRPKVDTIGFWERRYWQCNQKVSPF